MISSFFAVDLDLGAGPFAKQHPVAGFNFKLHQRAGVVVSAGTGCNNFTFLRLLFSGVGDDDAPGGLFFGIQPADHNAVMQWRNFAIWIAPINIDLCLASTCSPSGPACGTATASTPHRRVPIL